MKRTGNSMLYIFLLGVCMWSCGKDNYQAPESTLTGTVVYQGEPVGVRGSNQSVRLQLWQDGFQTREPIDVYVAQDGSFSAALFDGQYKLITVPGSGPWQHSADTLLIDLNGHATVEFPVDLYYNLTDVSYQLSGETLTATFQLDQLVDDRAVDEISLLIGNTKFVDLGHFLKRETLSSAQQGTFSISMDIGPELENNQTLFARVGVKINGITESLYDTALHQVK
ncbi:MAG TPA: DUF3823 domain-containing protein [Candidatus Sphingobacterium stercorigallinarum]|nr:DUF3823 domain-containing protein [Candidatus Sphingobacterium stercorigallinarum]